MNLKSPYLEAGLSAHELSSGPKARRVKDLVKDGPLPTTKEYLRMNRKGLKKAPSFCGKWKGEKWAKWSGSISVKYLRTLEAQ